MKFINLWLTRVTILNLTVLNNESGKCYIPPEEYIIYKDKAYPLPFIVPGWEKFEIKAINCAPYPDDRIITPEDIFQINVTSKYVIGEVFHGKYVEDILEDILRRILHRGIAIHKEKGWVRGIYKMVYWRNI